MNILKMNKIKKLKSAGKPNNAFDNRSFSRLQVW